jgi:hypothetical protein
MWFITASRSGGVQAASKARPITEWEIGTDVPMSGSVVMPLPLRQDSTYTMFRRSRTPIDTEPLQSSARSFMSGRAAWRTFIDASSG